MTYQPTQSHLMTFFILFSNLFLVFAQQSSGPDVKTAPDFASPDVASFMKFEDIKTNLYTGVPDINIPLHTIRDGAISIPINLRYHAGGIKVEEEASLVGLGWNLNIGGHVSRRTNGRVDINSYDHQIQKNSVLNSLSESNPYNLTFFPPITTHPYEMLQMKLKLGPYFGGHRHFAFQGDNAGGAYYGQVLRNTEG
ncbi:hypothetical protein [Nonlabens xiamenensis]|uniref:hypothetical protein n=1 Tax=Nonlabens xiamenensis TaxID=2341043 RepID=UPI000F610409|nr:hypothetical protein [Nonlabens xiamenensis]